MKDFLDYDPLAWYPGPNIDWDYFFYGVRLTPILEDSLTLEQFHNVIPAWMTLKPEIDQPKISQYSQLVVDDVTVASLVDRVVFSIANGALTVDIQGSRLVVLIWGRPDPIPAFDLNPISLKMPLKIEEVEMTQV